MIQSAGAKPAASSRKPPRKKPRPFIAFFEPVNQATQRNNCPAFWVAVSLMADFDAVLVRSFATPQTPWATTTQATERAGAHPGATAESSRKPAIWAASPIASIRAMPKRVASQPPMRFAPMPAAS